MLVTHDRIHWFGITNPYPASDDYYGPGTHRHIGHASAADPFGPWQEHEHALCLPEDTQDNIGAYFVVNYLLYAAAAHRGYGSVVCAVSDDLVGWHSVQPALIGDAVGDYGPLESPFVLKRRGWFYLFVNHSHHQYEETLVFASRDPRRFDWAEPLCTLFGHASEVFTWRGRTYITHCGIEDLHWGFESVLYLSELGWLEPGGLPPGASAGMPARPGVQ
jgi:hypothetical protein